MARSRRRKPKVVLRKSHMVYRGKSAMLSVWVWTRALILVGLALWLSLSAYAFWNRSDFWRVRGLSVKPGAPAGLEKKMGVAPGDHLFGFSTEQAELRLRRAFPELDDVRVRRGLDRRVRVSFKRRKPVARLVEGERVLGIDAQGVIFPLDPAARSKSFLPILAGTRGPAIVLALTFLERLSETEIPWTRRVQKVKMLPGGNLSLSLTEGTLLFWGERSLDQDVIRRKALRLERVLHDPAVLGGVDYIRFVDEYRIAVKPLAAQGEHPKETSGGKS